MSVGNIGQRLELGLVQNCAARPIMGVFQTEQTRHGIMNILAAYGVFELVGVKTAKQVVG